MFRSTPQRISWKPVITILVFGILAPLAAGAKLPVILSTDVGNEIDDQWAIVYLLTNPEFEVLGIVSAHAPNLTPPSAHTSYRCLLDVVEKRLGMSTHPPLFEGSSEPLPDRRTPQMNAGVSFIVEASRAFSKENRLNVVTIGAATDAASALLSDPTLSQRIRIVAMGFNRWPEGGDFFNVANDASAMQVIMDSDAPLVIGPGDICRRDLALNLDQARSIVAGRGPVGSWLWQEFQAWYFRQVKPLRVNDLSRPWFIWDTITLAYLLGMTQQDTYARPHLKDDLAFAHGQKGKTITWINHVDSKRMWADFEDKLDTFQRTHAVRDWEEREHF